MFKGRSHRRVISIGQAVRHFVSSRLFSFVFLLVQVDFFTSLPPVDLLVIRNQSGLIFHWQSLSSSDLLTRYRLQIDRFFFQEFPPVKFDDEFDRRSPFRTFQNVHSVYLPYTSQREWHRRLNVTLALIHDETIRQEQTIFIDPEKHDGSFFIASASRSFLSPLLLLCLFH